jgi:Rrf2 family protein
MIHLAGQPEGTVVSRSLLAEAAEAPESFLSKILQALARAGLIQARRGVGGGFSLSAPGARASLLEVVESIDGPIALNACLTSGGSCHRSAGCAAHQAWLRAQSAMLSVLRQAKIAEMVPAQPSRHAPLNLAQAAPNRNREPQRGSPPGETPPKPRTTARPRFAPAAAPRQTSRNGT